MPEVDIGDTVQSSTTPVNGMVQRCPSPVPQSPVGTVVDHMVDNDAATSLQFDQLSIPQSPDNAPTIPPHVTAAHRITSNAGHGTVADPLPLIRTSSLLPNITDFVLFSSDVLELPRDGDVFPVVIGNHERMGGWHLPEALPLYPDGHT